MCRNYTSVIVGKTPTSNKTGEKLSVVVQDPNTRPVNTKRYFLYRQNPVVEDIFPRPHLLRYADL